MKTEIEFLEQIKNEFATAEYGEGISFNLNEIVGTINDRIRQVKKLSKANVIKSVCDQCRFKAECRFKEMNTEQNCKYFIDEQTVL